MRCITVFLLISYVLGGFLRKDQAYERIKTIAIVGTNDIHGSAFPKQFLRVDTGQTYQYGGLVYMGRLIQIIQEDHKGRVLYLDGGDQFQGGIEASEQVSSGEIIADFYNVMNLSTSSIGNHEFDFGPDFLDNYLEKKDAPSLAANLQNEKGQINFLPKQKSTAIYDVDGIKIGVIGLSTLETPATTSGFVDNLFPDYKFLEYRDVVVKYSDGLKSDGAEIILLVAHVGNDCPQNKTYDIRTAETPQEECPPDEITNLIDVLPEGTIHGIVQGHRHEWVHHWKKGIPFMGVINGGYHFNVMYINFDTETRKVVGTAIEGPIPVCQKLFENTLDCQFKDEEQLKTAGSLKHWTFHNRLVYAHPEVSRVFNEKWVPLMADYFEPVFETEIVLARIRDQENPLVNLITTMLRNAVPDVDFSFINHGSFRSTWYPGTVQFQDFYNMFPFTNVIQSFSLTGAELKQTLAIIQSGEKGFYYFDGITQFVSLTQTGNSEYLEPGFINATMSDGSPIIDDKVYRGLSLEFLINGGDDFAEVIGPVFTPQDVKNEGDQRDILEAQLRELGTVKKGVWVDPQNPRMTVVHN